MGEDEGGRKADGLGEDDAAATFLTAGYQRLELALIEVATAGLTGSALPEGAPLVSAETAIKLLSLRAGGAVRDGRSQKPQLDPQRLRMTLAARLAAVRHAAARPAPPPPE